MSSIAEAMAHAAQTFTGRLLQPTDHAYDDRRRVHNGLIDKRPAAIACCHGVADVVDAVQLARALGLEVSVRGGGHNVAGRATIDQGLMIDLSPMKGIHVDVAARTVRAQGGVLWSELNRETQLHGLATTGGVVGSTGIAGLTLGGGLGWLMPKYGLALDNLRSAEMVMADGTRRARERRRESGSVLGDSRRRRQLRHRRVARVRPAPGRADDHRRRRRPSVGASARRAALLPGYLRVVA